MKALFQHPNPRASLDHFKTFNAGLYAIWKKELEQAVEPTELNARARAVLVVGLDSVAYWSPAVIERHIDEAFDAGSNVAELLEAVMHVSMLEAGAHGMHEGLTALEMVVRAREKAGQPALRRGAGLAPEDRVREAPWPIPAVFPYQTPFPRYHVQVLDKYDPVLAAAWSVWNQARFNARTELTRKMQELLVTAVDVAILYPEPLLDHHLHAAFEVGATAQEILETTILAATAVQGAHVSYPAGKQYEGGAVAIQHGLTALERVLSQREGAGLLARRDASKPKTGRVALTR